MLKLLAYVAGRAVAGVSTVVASRPGAIASTKVPLATNLKFAWENSGMPLYFNCKFANLQLK
jgi:hypothetical protein